MRKLTFYFIGLILAGGLYARDTLVTQNLRHNWIGLAANGELTPYTPGSSAELIFFELTESGPQDYLLLKSEKAVDIWLNNNLIFLQFDSTAVLHLDSLFEVVGNRLRFKIFSEGGMEESMITQKIRIGTFTEVDLIDVKERRMSAANDLYLITLSIVLLLAGMFRRFFPSVFNQSIQHPLSLKVRSATDRTYESFGNADNLYSMFFLGAISTLFFTYLGYDLKIFSGSGILNGLINWLLASLILALAVTLKYFWAKVIAFLYQYRDVPNIQVQDFIRFFTLVMILGLVFTLIDFTLFNASSLWFRDLTGYLVLLALLFFQVWFFRKFDRYYGHKKLMIFSYLCTTEFLPGFLAIYWLVKM